MLGSFGGWLLVLVLVRAGILWLGFMGCGLWVVLGSVGCVLGGSGRGSLWVPWVVRGLMSVVFWFAWVLVSG